MSLVKFFLLQVIVFVVFPFFGCAQVHTIKDLNFLLKYTTKDSTSKTERLAAIEFHNLVNQHRKKYRKTPFLWNDSLWLVSLNHNKYMANTDKLSHDEKMRSNFYTGKSCLDRRNFIFKKIPNTYHIAENILFFSIEKGLNCKETATNIAKEAFIIWKNSKPHNTNMLDKNFLEHSISFYINEDLVWGTDVFYKDENNIQIKK